MRVPVAAIHGDEKCQEEEDSSGRHYGHIELCAQGLGYSSSAAWLELLQVSLGSADGGRTAAAHQDAADSDGTGGARTAAQVEGPT